MVEFPDAESWMSPFNIASFCEEKIWEKFSITVWISRWPRRETVLFPGLSKTLKMVACPRIRSSLFRFSVTLPYDQNQGHDYEEQEIISSYTNAKVTTEWLGRTATPAKLAPSASSGMSSWADSIEKPRSLSSPLVRLSVTDLSAV